MDHDFTFEKFPGGIRARSVSGKNLDACLYHDDEAEAMRQAVSYAEGVRDGSIHADREAIAESLSKM